MVLSYYEARLSALTLTSMLYGLNLITFFLSLQRLFRGRDGKRDRRIHFPMTMVVILLFICSTTVLGLQLALVMRSYMYLLQSREDDFETERRAFILSQVSFPLFLWPDCEPELSRTMR